MNLSLSLALVVLAQVPQQQEPSGNFDQYGQRQDNAIVVSPAPPLGPQPSRYATIPEWADVCLSARTKGNRGQAREALDFIATYHREQQPLTTSEQQLAAAAGRKLSESDDSETRLTGIHLLTNVNDDACKPALVGLLRDKDRKVKLKAMEGLSRHADNGSIPAVVAAIKGDVGMWIRGVQALRSIGSPAARAQLVKWNQVSTPAQVRAAIDSALDALDFKAK